MKHGILVGSLALAFWCAPARAEEVSAENKAAARDLAISGIQLAQGGKCEEALGSLERAEALFHAPTILTWIGQCQLELGRVVAGTETLRQVIREQLESDAPSAYLDAQFKARKLLDKHEPRIAKLTITVSGPDGDLSSAEGLEVTVDEMSVAPALIGAPRPTDPGERVVSAQLPGYEPASQTVVLTDGAQDEVSFQLHPSSGPIDSAEGDEASMNDRAPGRGRRTVGWVLVGSGAAALAGGAVTGILALTGESKLDCPNRDCPDSEADALRGVRTNATLSTVLLSAGGALTVGGVLVLVTGKKQQAEVATWHLPLGSSEASAQVTLAPQIGWGRLGVVGSF